MQRHHVELRDINYKSIVPYLNKYGLIPSSEYTPLNNMLSKVDLETNYSKIDNLISILPSCGHDDFVLRFIHCLRESAPEAGEIHEELANTLQKALAAASKEEDEEEKRKEEDTESEAATELTLFVTNDKGVCSNNLQLRQREVVEIENDNRGIIYFFRDSLFSFSGLNSTFDF